MRKFVLLFAVVVAGGFLAGCSGLNQNGKLFSAHGESLNLFGFQIPEDSMIAAKSKVPANAKVTTVVTAPDDTSSLLGILNRIFGMGYTAIGGEVAE